MRRLVADLLNPYASFEGDSSKGSGVSSELVGWIESNPYLSSKTVAEIRAGLELFQSMKERYATMKGKDPKQLQAEGGSVIENGVVTDIIFGPISVTFILDGGEKEGGFHQKFLFLPQRFIGDPAMSDGSGGFNVVYRATPNLAAVIAHENGHSLQEIFLKHRAGRSVVDIWKEETRVNKGGLQEVDRQHTSLDLDHILQRMLESMPVNFFDQFADEAMAHMLHNMKQNDSPREFAKQVFSKLTTSRNYWAITPDEMSRSGFISSIVDPLLTYADQETILPLSEQSDESLRVKSFCNYVEEHITLDIFFLKCSEITLSIADLLTAGFCAEEIMSIFAGESPLRWKKITDRIIYIERNLGSKTVFGEEDPLFLALAVLT
ncbi:MAG: hypothetical protein NUV84_02820 [Candidatus Uhrbacteria bacterium]|nr:hypothetical protein [Candidatus Uhrbacteria bacterium]